MNKIFFLLTSLALSFTLFCPEITPDASEYKKISLEYKKAMSKFKNRLKSSPTSEQIANCNLHIKKLGETPLHYVMRLVETRFIKEIREEQKKVNYLNTIMNNNAFMSQYY